MCFVLVLLFARHLVFEALGAERIAFTSAGCKTHSFANLAEPLWPGISDQVLVPFPKTMTAPVPCGGASQLALPGEAAGSCSHLFY